MREKKSSHIVPIDDFQVTKKGPHISEYDEEIKKKYEQDQYEQWVRENTIDDDAPDIEKEDEYG